ncbi:MAG TPA: hypothetical protein ENJ75_02800 [Candidatus Kaiserbacteria bacterium]|nr:hypothetical protein [Candidatus Kaiserbacteria bacterium]
MMESFNTQRAYENDKSAVSHARKEHEKTGTKKTRREFLKELGILVTAISAITGIETADKLASNAHTRKDKPKKKEESITDKKIKDLKQKLREQNVSEEGDGLEKYTFLHDKEKTRSFSVGALEGKKLSNLYAMYLGVDEKGTIPEKLQIDFKANLARLWRMKFGFDKHTDSPEKEKIVRELFLKEHKDLMDLAEHLYCSYSQSKAKKVSLDEYSKDIVHATKSVQRAFMNAMYELRNDAKFPRARRALIEKMASRISSRKLIACSLTELMPSADGETNAIVLDFLLRNAGTDFIDAIPSVHDLLASFGPYQLTPALFAPGGVGHLSEKVEALLPKGLIPKSVEKVSGIEHHKVAYFVAIEHLTQLSGRLSQRELVIAEERIAKTPPDILHKEILAFIAMSHHLPTEAYSYFGHVFTQTPKLYKREFEKSINHVHNRGLRMYVQKALSNYDFLSKRGALTSV